MIKPIETLYAGYRFRSRLEARWAVVFDAWGVDWEYEPEGFELGNGMRYLPDFLIKGGVGRCPDKLYIEVKGELTGRDKTKLDTFSGYDTRYSDNYAHIKNPVLLVGGIPKCSSPYEAWDDYWRRWEHSKDHEDFYNFCRVDGDVYEAFPGIDRNGRFSLFHDNRNYMEDMDFSRTNAGYIAGRSARFERKPPKSALKRFGTALYNRPNNAPKPRNIENFDPDYIAQQEYLFYGDPCGANDN